MLGIGVGGFVARSQVPEEVRRNRAGLMSRRTGRIEVFCVPLSLAILQAHVFIRDDRFVRGARTYFHMNWFRSTALSAYQIGESNRQADMKPLLNTVFNLEALRGKHQDNFRSC